MPNSTPDGRLNPNCHLYFPTLQTSVISYKISGRNRMFPYGNSSHCSYPAPVIKALQGLRRTENGTNYGVPGATLFTNSINTFNFGVMLRRVG